MSGELIEGQTITTEGDSVAGNILYTRPQIYQSQELLSQAEIERKVEVQPTITKKTITQPIIR